MRLYHNKLLFPTWLNYKSIWFRTIKIGYLYFLGYDLMSESNTIIPLPHKYATAYDCNLTDNFSENINVLQWKYDELF